jgi:hypothetical protein
MHKPTTDCKHDCDDENGSHWVDANDNGIGDLDEGSKAGKEQKIPVSEFILSMFDRDAGKFPKGETAIALEHPQWAGRLDTVMDIIKHYSLLYPRLDAELVAGYIPEIINKNKKYKFLSTREKLFLINALTLFSGASVLLFDEPFHYMKDEEKTYFLILLNKIVRDSAVAIISVFGSNDLVEFVDDFIIMREGIITYSGSVKEAQVKHRIVRSIEGITGEVIGPLIDSFLVKTGEAVGWEPTLEEILHAYTHYRKG